MRVILEHLRARLREEDGIALAAVVGALAVSTLLVAGSVAAVNGDLNVGKYDLERKQAYEAAQAGLADYMFHLNQDTNYWSKCTSVPMPNAINQINSTTKRRSVPGTSGASYALELIPATGKSSCDTTDPVGSMIEQSGQRLGTFRIRSTGYSGAAKQRIVAQFKRASFLDYVYFTQLETSDPVTYPDQATIDGAYTQCTKTIVEGRYSAPIPNSGGKYCDVIFFVQGEQINGPLHTNDALVLCGSPTFGRSPADAIEVSSAPPGYYQGCSGGGTPNFLGTYVTSAPVLTPPPTNGSLSKVAGAVKYTGQTRIVLSGTNMTVTTSTGTSTVPIPSSGVVYVSNGSCSGGLNPYTVTYPSPSGCGNAIVSGSYSGQLTIAAENDVIIDDDLIRSGNGLLGLIANNFVRVKHPICPQADLNCSEGAVPAGSAQTGKGSCTPPTPTTPTTTFNGNGSQPNLRIDAAMLAISHSFIVDHYDCGASLGTLTVNGAISQKFRGAVGTFGAAPTGYTKNYNYDDRLRYISPPHFLDPVQSAWGMQRQTLDP